MDTQILTAEEYADHPRGHEPGELVRGVMHIMNAASGAHGIVVDNIHSALSLHVRARRLGRVFGDNVGFQLTIPGATADTVRSPDVAFVRRERLPVAGMRARGWVKLAPDLVVEVRSPDNRPAQIEARLRDYFASGTELAWIVDPPTRTVERRTPGTTLPTLGESDTLDGGDVLPDFTMPVADLFDGLARDG